MTLSSITTKVTYNGDGSTTDFAIGFVFWGGDDLRVIHRDAGGTETLWTRGTQYTLTGGAGAAGTLTVKAAPTDYTPASGETLTIKDAQPETQGDSLPLSGAFPSTVVEQRLDKLTRMVQIHSEEAARSILLPETASLSGLVIPEPGAGELVRYNAGGTALETVVPGDVNTAFSALLSGLADDDFLIYETAGAVWKNLASGATGRALLGDAGAADARTTLGLGTAALVGTGAAAGDVPTNDQAFADVASATTTDIGAAASLNVRITGTTTITGLGTVAAGISRNVRFAAALTLTQNATSLILPGSANITTAADDTAEFISLGSGNWLCQNYKRADGAPLGGILGAKIWLHTETVSSSVATVDIESGDFDWTAYDILEFEIYNLTVVNDDVDLFLRIWDTTLAAWQSGAADYGWTSHRSNVGSVTGGGDPSDSEIQLLGGATVLTALGNAAGEKLWGTVKIFEAPSSADTPMVTWLLGYHSPNGQVNICQGSGEYIGATNVISGFRLLAESGNIDGAVINVYGIRTS